MKGTWIAVAIVGMVVCAVVAGTLIGLEKGEEKDGARTDEMPSDGDGVEGGGGYDNDGSGEDPSGLEPWISGDGDKWGDGEADDAMDDAMDDGVEGGEETGEEEGYEGGSSTSDAPTHRPSISTRTTEGSWTTIALDEDQGRIGKQTRIVANDEFDPDYLVLVFKSSADGDFDWHYSASHDGGSSWTDARKAFDTKYDVDIWECSCDVEMDDQGIVHLIWSHYPYETIGTYTGPIGVYYSNFDGELWSSPLALIEEHGTEEEPRDEFFYNMELAPGREGIIHVIFGATEAYGSVDAGQMWYTNSRTGGRTWSPPVDVNQFDGMDVAPRPALCADDWGHVHLAFGPDWYSDELSAETYYLKSSDDGETWGEQRAITNIPGASEGEVTMHCDGDGGVYLIYKSTSTVESSEVGVYWDIRTMYSTDHGDSWTQGSGGEPIASNYHRYARQHSILDDDGFIHIVYDDMTEAGVREGYYMLIDLEGKIIISPEMCTPEPGIDSIVRSITVLDGTVYVGADELVPQGEM